MTKFVNPALLPTVARYKSLFLQGARLSTLRALEYEALHNKKFYGRILDFGGGERTSYRHYITCDVYDSVNIDPRMNPTWLTGVGDRLPSPADTYDFVVSMNTFEHIYDVVPIVRDIFTTLKAGGEFVCSTPLLYPVHGHPDDFCRFTASWWDQTLNTAGFKDIKITPLIWGPFSTATLCSGIPGPCKRLRTHISLLMDLVYAKLRFGLKEKYFSGAPGQTVQNHALGYFIEARKQ